MQINEFGDGRLLESIVIIIVLIIVRSINLVAMVSKLAGRNHGSKRMIDLSSVRFIVNKTEHM